MNELLSQIFSIFFNENLSSTLLNLFFDPAKFNSSNGKLSKSFVIRSYVSKNLWAKHERSRPQTHKSKTLQSVSRQPGAGESRGQNVKKFSPKKYFWESRHFSLGKKAKKARPGEAATCLQKMSLFLADFFYCGRRWIENVSNPSIKSKLSRVTLINHSPRNWRKNTIF